MTIWDIEILNTPIGIVYIGVIRDEENTVAPHKRPRVEVQLLGENLADTVEQDGGLNSYIRAYQHHRGVVYTGNKHNP